MNVAATQKHYSPKELAELWAVSEETIRRVFRDRPGVVVLGGKKRLIIRIPESVVLAVHDERSRGFVAKLKSSGRRV